MNIYKMKANDVRKELIKFGNTYYGKIIFLLSYITFFYSFIFLLGIIVVYYYNSLIEFPYLLFFGTLVFTLLSFVIGSVCFYKEVRLFVNSSK